MRAAGTTGAIAMGRRRCRCWCCERGCRAGPRSANGPSRRSAWSLLATAFLVIATLAGPGPSLSDWLGDTDDAVRLVTVRELIGGAPWFDTTLPRIGAPEPLVSHWSRLIDAPLAALIGGLTPLLGPERAELATRVVWPALLFFALALIVAREAQRRAGPVGAAFAVMLVATSAVALAQFRPGRVDHHNAQILCAVAGLLLLPRSLDDKRAGWIAGLPARAGARHRLRGDRAGGAGAGARRPGGRVAVVACLEQRGDGGDGVARAGAGAAATLLAALVATVPPARWLDVHCDALSLNLVLLAACGAGGLWAAVSVRGRPAIRLGLLGVGLAVGAGLYTGLEPACLAGPFGQSSPALKSLWLDHVMETKSIFWLGTNHPAPALAAVAFLLAGAAAQIALWRRQPDTRTGAGRRVRRAGGGARVLADQADALRLLAGRGAAGGMGSRAEWDGHAVARGGASRRGGAAEPGDAGCGLRRAALAFPAVGRAFGHGSGNWGSAPGLLPVGQCPPARRVAARAGGRRHRPRPLHRRLVAAPGRGRALPSARAGHSRQPRHRGRHAGAGAARAGSAGRRLRGSVRGSGGRQRSAGDAKATTLSARLLAGEGFGFLNKLDLPTAGAIKVWKVAPPR